MSRSELRRQAAHRGEPAPDFSTAPDEHERGVIRQLNADFSAMPSEADELREKLARSIDVIDFWAKSANDWKDIAGVLSDCNKELIKALAVLVTTPLTRSWLETNDPMALQQALRALPAEYLPDPDDAA